MNHPSQKTWRRGIGIVALQILALVGFTAHAEALPGTDRTYSLPEGLSNPQLAPIQAVEQVTLPRLDVEKLLAQDQTSMKDQPLRFAIAQPVFRGLGKGGSWETLDDGRSIWRLALHAEDATGIVPVFDRFYLPLGAELHLYAADGSWRVRPYTSRHNRPERQLWAPMVPGDRLVVELVLPPGAGRDQAQLHLGEVGHAYRDLSGRTAHTGVVEKSGACNIDTACDLGAAWSDEVRGVARLQIGFFVCTGFLVNNTTEDDRPLLMTANHCGLTAANDQSVLAYWNYQNSTCRTPDSQPSGADGDGVLDQFTTGTTLLAADDRSDFTLVELMESPAPFGVYLLGWDANKVAPSSAVTIHHPQGEEKRISREMDATSFDIYPHPSTPPDLDSHIRVEDWDEGTTEGGSSGSPLFDETSRRVVGQLHGGLAACGNDDPDWYGAMWRSFELGLRPVLDPGGTGATFIDGRDFGSSNGPNDPDDPDDPGDPGDVEPFHCVEDATTLCLNDGRFQVRADWMDFLGSSNAARAVPVAAGDSGMFWFFSASNLELLIKVLDGCSYNGRYWVFAGAATHVEYVLTVTDSRSGEVKIYHNPQGMVADTLTDTGAFATCP